VISEVEISKDPILQFGELHVASHPRKPVKVKHMAIIFFHHSKVVRNFAKDANLPGIRAE
jgi:hypothetical protein